MLPADLAGARPGGSARKAGGFAVIADTHMDPYNPRRTEDMRAVFEHILGREGDPAFVFHVGDVVEAGFPEEYEEFEGAVPEELEGQILAVPGNHEVRWDEWAKELYFERFRQTPYSFDAAGVHFVALDPTNLLQEPGYFSDEQLRWLERDLKRAGKGTPSVVYIHYPMGRDNYYVGNQDAFFRVVEPYNVRAVVAGHIHREEVVRQNGMTVITLPAIRNSAVYDWVDFGEGPGVPRSLTFYRAERNRTTGVWSEVLTAEVPLAGRRPAEDERPQKISFDPDDGSTARLAVRMSPRSRAAGVSYRFWPEYTWAGKNSEGWAEATRSGDRPKDRVWRAEVDTSSLALGSYRLQVRATDPSGAYWDAYERVEVPGREEGALRVLGERRLGAAVQAGLAEVPARRGAAPLAVAATTAGRVVGLRADRRGRIAEEWSFEAGEAVIGTPAASAGGGRVFVGSVNHNVYALDTESGERLWRFATEQPALGSPLWTESPRGGEGLVLAPAGNSLHALDAASGELAWRADTGGFIGGRPQMGGRRTSGRGTARFTPSISRPAPSCGSVS